VVAAQTAAQLLAGQSLKALETGKHN